MFVEKQFKKSVNIIQTRIFFFAFRQINIINYFKSVSSSKVKFIKFNVFTVSFSSASVKFVSINQIARISHCHVFASKHLFLHRFFHICRFCHGIFTSNNDLHRHLKLTHLILKSNQSSRDSILHGRNIDFMIKFSVFREHIIHCINNFSSLFHRHHDNSFESIK